MQISMNISACRNQNLATFLVLDNAVTDAAFVVLGADALPTHELAGRDVLIGKLSKGAGRSSVGAGTASEAAKRASEVTT